MALLTVAKRKEYFKVLGLKYDEDGILKFQKMAFPKMKKEQDKKYGEHTDKALRHFRNVKLYAPHFMPEEFKCDCGGRHCTGYPTQMRVVELKHLEKIRKHYNKPMMVTCGLRCKGRNKELAGAIQNSLHLHGRACDFYMAGVTDTLANRKSAIKWIKTLSNHHYTYGDGINSYGSSVYAPYMGNALHTDVNPPKVKSKPTEVKATKNADKIIAKAKEFCWKYGEKSSKWSYGKGHAKAAYKKALKKHMKKKAKISQSDCGYFVSTCVRAAGVNKSFNSLHQFGKVPKGFKRVLKGKKIPKGFLKPGDIIRYKKKSGQHTLMYYGNGKTAEAGRGHWFPRIRKNKKQYNASNVRKSTIEVLRAK